MLYNLSEPKIQYTNDFEYRACLRKLFCMVSPETTDLDDIDEVSKDELEYDPDACNKSLDFIYSNTSEHPLFQELYDVGAAKMLSLDRTIGLAVLMSYDYMALFHQCIYCYMKTPDEFLETNDAFVSLKKKIT